MDTTGTTHQQTRHHRLINFAHLCNRYTFFCNSPTTGTDCFNVTKRSELLIWIDVVIIMQVLLYLVLDIYRVGTEDEAEDG